MRNVRYRVLMNTKRFPTSGELWKKWKGALSEARLLEPAYAFRDGGAPCPVDSVEKRIRTDAKLHLFGRESEIYYTTSGGTWPVVDLYSNKVIDDADELTRATLDVAEIVSAGLFDVDYHVQQSEIHPHQYEVFGWSLEGVRLIDHYAWEKIVDISDNPGRTEPGEGYQAEFGHKMWLSSTFWERTGASRDEVARLALRVEDFGAGVEKFVFAEDYFTRPDDRQRRIRAALFPKEARGTK